MNESFLTSVDVCSEKIPLFVKLAYPLYYTVGSVSDTEMMGGERESARWSRRVKIGVALSIRAWCHSCVISTAMCNCPVLLGCHCLSKTDRHPGRDILDWSYDYVLLSIQSSYVHWYLLVWSAFILWLGCWSLGKWNVSLIHIKSWLGRVVTCLH